MMAIRTLSIGLAAVAAAVLALPGSSQAGHEHWFYDSYQAYEYQASPYGYYRPVPSPRVRPYAGYGPPPAYQAPRRWFPSATPPRYWFPPTEPPRQLRRSAPPAEVYEARRPPAPPPVPRSKPEHRQPKVATREASASETGQRPADTDIVTGSLAPVTPGPETASPETATPAKRNPPREVAAVSAPAAAEQAERQPAAANAAGKVSCEAAAGIIGDFGFSDVRAKQCDGQVYDFDATRDGKGYSIKLSAADGELTEVRRH